MSLPQFWVYEKPAQFAQWNCWSERAEGAYADNCPIAMARCNVFATEITIRPFGPRSFATNSLTVAHRLSL